MAMKFLKASLPALAAALLAAGAFAADPAAAPAKPQAQEPIYGSQLMTRQERIEHRNKMRSLKTPEERQAYRAEHHRLMQERAKERGVTLPDMPPPRGPGMGMGMGPGGGPGPGMGMGRGMGPGPGMGQGMGPGGQGAAPSEQNK